MYIYIHIYVCIPPVYVFLISCAHQLVCAWHNLGCTHITHECPDPFILFWTTHFLKILIWPWMHEFTHTHTADTTVTRGCGFDPKGLYYIWVSYISAHKSLYYICGFDLKGLYHIYDLYYMCVSYIGAPWVPWLYISFLNTHRTRMHEHAHGGVWSKPGVKVWQ